MIAYLQQAESEISSAIILGCVASFGLSSVLSRRAPGMDLRPRFARGAGAAQLTICLAIAVMSTRIDSEPPCIDCTGSSHGVGLVAVILIFLLSMSISFVIGELWKRGA